jgi:hypothetical protein
VKTGFEFPRERHFFSHLIFDTSRAGTAAGLCAVTHFKRRVFAMTYFDGVWCIRTNATHLDSCDKKAAIPSADLFAEHKSVISSLSRHDMFGAQKLQMRILE